MKRLTLVGQILGALALVAGIVLTPARTGAGLLVLGWVLLGAGLTGCLGLAVQYPNRAPEADGLRAVCVRLTRLLPAGSVAILLALVFCPQLFAGYTLEPGQHDGFKMLWLGRGFHLTRSVIILALWLGSARVLCAISEDLARLQGRSGFWGAVARNYTTSAWYFYVFGITVSIASVDWLMVLQPHWVSTIVGLYGFASVILGGLAVFLLAWLVRPASELERASDTRARRHDVGQIVMCFSCLWVYLWFSQFLLIWYTGIPEETMPYITLLKGAWAPLFWLSLFLNFLVPFVILLPREAKQSGSVLTKIAVLLLLGRVIDLAVWIYPPAVGDAPKFGWVEIGLLIGTASLACRSVLGRRSA